MAIPDNLNLDISIQCEKWRQALPDHEEIIDKSLQQIMENIPEGKLIDQFASLELSIVLCDDPLIRQLNKDFRGQDKATNVLSFQGIENDKLQRFLTKKEIIPSHPEILGEIYISYQTMINEANKDAISLSDHFYHLCIHGLLHLLGFDHIEDDQAEIMEALEIKLLAKLAIDDPYRA